MKFYIQCELLDGNHITYYIGTKLYNLKEWRRSNMVLSKPLFLDIFNTKKLLQTIIDIDCELGEVDEYKYTILPVLQFPLPSV